ncbi:LPXTG cell wall anchor domain-containing protein, partial [Faecalibaculum rodentium]
PETGGMGTTVIYGVGAVMVAGAAVFYVTNKRTRKD